MVLELSLSIRGIPMVLDITLSPATDFLASCAITEVCAPSGPMNVALLVTIRAGIKKVSSKDSNVLTCSGRRWFLMSV